jgi:hypothetical protein
METMTLTPARTLMVRLGALALTFAFALALTLGPAAADASAGGEDDRLVIAAEERERRPIAPTQRSQFALFLYVLMGVGVVVGGATMRRQL